MQQYFDNKTIWITGASSGLGEALAYALSKCGANLILSARRLGELERVAEFCEHSEKVKCLPLDMTDLLTLDAKTQEAIAAFGGIDMVFQNAGISSRSLCLDTSTEIQRQVMEVNYFSIIHLTRILLPHFIQRGKGHIIVTSSVMGKIGTPMRSAYAGSKHALHGYFDCLRAELKANPVSRNIEVTVLTPGYIRTNISKYAVQADGSPLGHVSQNIAGGLPADLAALQVLKAVARKKKEAYIGRFGGERLALWIMRFAPGLMFRIAPGLAPK
jgi:short-subunit dehydrogenase